MAMLAGRVAAWQHGRTFETDTPEELETVYNSEDLPISHIEDEFSQARHYLGQAVRHLVRAANVADPYGQAQMIDELVNHLDDDFDSQMTKVMKRLKEGA